MVKNPPAMQEMQETWVPFLGLEDALEKEMATHPKYSSLGHPTDRGAWQATVHSVEECK